MVIRWKGPGCLLLGGRQLIKPGEVIPDGALTAARIEELRSMLTFVTPTVVQPVRPVQPINHVAAASPFASELKKTPDVIKVGPKGRNENTRR